MQGRFQTPGSSANDLFPSLTEPHSDSVHLSVCLSVPALGSLWEGTWPQGSVLLSLGLRLLGEECAHWCLDSLPRCTLKRVDRALSRWLA